MKLTLLAVGHRMPAWAEQATAEYLKRLPHEARMTLVTVKPERRIGQPVATIRSREAARLREKIPAGSRLVVLDEHGRQTSTRELAGLLADWLAAGKDTVLLIGGADGLAPELLARAEHQLALSRLTLPHALVRVLLAEQVYRAISMLRDHPYHRE
ncbi:MAG TPA: 23S rRNA (pseudouridine(1915)-N(3))-methyltransferase RlmH [Thiobacillaceae bacterium]|nr:23S rRNA (pseudouridine(1915)-N(3))-methyltransferase RlmH [Thiobacillaceae bacterium]HNU65342.1 23S rRNA (pseudouridine(1915)-N(3))-methyltransferase RlmH [Thiobacillaceae bacterium]